MTDAKAGTSSGCSATAINSSVAAVETGDGQGNTRSPVVSKKFVSNGGAKPPRPGKNMTGADTVKKLLYDFDGYKEMVGRESSDGFARSPAGLLDCSYQQETKDIRALLSPRGVDRRNSS